MFEIHLGVPEMWTLGTVPSVHFLANAPLGHLSVRSPSVHFFCTLIQPLTTQPFE